MKKTIIGLIGIFILCSFLTKQDLIYTSHTQDFVFPKATRFNPDEFPSFVTVRAHKFGYADDGSFQLTGEPYLLLVNISQVTRVYPFEDTQENEGVMIHFVGEDVPVLALQPFKDILKSFRKASVKP